MKLAEKTQWKAIKGKCPVCQHEGWCTVSGDGLVMKCMRVQNSHGVKQRDGQTGYLHRLDSIQSGSAAAQAIHKPYRPRLTKPELTLMLKQHRADLTAKQREWLSNNLGITAASLMAYGLGWDTRAGCYTFPMFDGQGKPCGFRRRYLDGRKTCVPGSQNGLFIPDDYDPAGIPDEVCESHSPLLLLLPEGPTDCGAARDMGFRAIGRPSAMGGFVEIEQFLKPAEGRAAQDVVVVADRDEAKFTPDGMPYWPGIEGALALAEKVYPHAAPLRFILPPDGIKDLRAWLASGAPEKIRGQLLFEILKAKPVNAQWFSKARSKLQQNKQAQTRPKDTAMRKST